MALPADGWIFGDGLAADTGRGRRHEVGFRRTFCLLFGGGFKETGKHIIYPMNGVSSMQTRTKIDNFTA